MIFIIYLILPKIQVNLMQIKDVKMIFFCNLFRDLLKLIEIKIKKKN